MNDFNMVNVDQSINNEKNLDKITQYNLKLQLEHYQSLLPILKDLQNESNKLVKEFHEYFSQKQRKIGSLPYKMFKKFQSIRTTLLQLQKMLNRQSLFYKINILNRNHQKDHDQLFFKKVLKSYDQKRLYMKEYILRNESKMQEVQEVVKEKIDYETHRYTQYLNLLTVERLEHNYEMKMEEVEKIIRELEENIKMREAIKKIIEIKRSKEKQQKQKKQNKQLQQIIKNKGKVQQKEGSPKQTKNQEIQKVYSSLELKISHNLVYFCQTKQLIRNYFLFFHLIKLQKLQKSTTQKNKILKSSLDKVKQYLSHKNIQNNLIYQQWATKYNHNEFLIFHPEQPNLNNKITKTDYFIYLKELHRSTMDFMATYGFYFVYLIENNHKVNPFKKSYSALKYYPCKYNAKKLLKQKQFKMKLKQIQKYRVENLDNILQLRKARQQQRYILQKDVLLCENKEKDKQVVSDDYLGQKQGNILLDDWVNEIKGQQGRNDIDLQEVSLNLHQMNGQSLKEEKEEVKQIQLNEQQQGKQVQIVNEQKESPALPANQQLQQQEWQFAA